MDLQHHLVDHVYFVLFEIGPIVFKLTKHTLVMWIGAAVTLLMGLYVAWRYRSSVTAVPRGVLMNAIEAFVLYVRDEMVYPIMGEENGKRYLGLILTTFLFILVCNFLGLIPEISLIHIPGTEIPIYPSAAATGNPWINFGLAIFVLGVGFVAGVLHHGHIGYLLNFIPHGVPWPIAILLFPIEIFGLLIKHAVLAVRLLANMIAGHAILFGILGASVIFVNVIESGALGFGASAVPVLLALLIYALEVLVAIIQAYVFAILSVIFLDMQVSGH